MKSRLAISLVLIFTLWICYSAITFAESPGGIALKAGEKIAVLDFQALDDKGQLIDPTELKQVDLVNLSRVMAIGVTSRLVQYGEFEVYDSAYFKKEDGSLPFALNSLPSERAKILLAEHGMDQVITGSMILLQTTAVVSAQRFSLVDGEVKLIGSAMATAAKVSDAPTTIDGLLASLFPVDVQVIERGIEQVFLVPSQLRLNLGSSAKITAYAVDNLGRPVANPSFLYFSNDEGKLDVRDDGTIAGLQPGTATVTVRGVSRTARSGPPTTLNVTVVPPALGVRLGTLVTDRDAIEGRPIRLGLRLTPSTGQSKPPTPTAPAPSTDSTNPLGFISSFFGSLLTNGLVTIDLDFDPTREMLFALNGVQRSSSGYIGTGVGYVTPLGESTHQAFAFRFTVGTQARLNSRITFPVEAVMDMMFPTSSTSKPSFRIGVNVGLDLFP